MGRAAASGREGVAVGVSGDERGERRKGRQDQGAPQTPHAVESKRVGADEMWDKAEAALQRTLAKNDLAYELNEGDGAFYGPKIDAHMEDAIGR